MNPNGEPVNPSTVAIADKPPIVSVEPTTAPADQFVNQFGSGLNQPPAAEAPTLTDIKPSVGMPTASTTETPVASLDSSIKTIDDLLAKGPQVVDNLTAEATKLPDQTPAEKLKEQISASVDAFLAEVTAKEGTAV